VDVPDDEPANNMLKSLPKSTVPQESTFLKLTLEGD
jgi:hypothetical protein